MALPFKGSYADFRHTLRHELVHVFQLSLRPTRPARYPRRKHVALPLWWTEGLAEFFSAGEDSRDEMILRDLTVSGRLPSLGDLTVAGGGDHLSDGREHPSVPRRRTASGGSWPRV